MTDNTRLQDCLTLLGAGPKDLPDTHKAIVYLLHHKHTHAITCTLVTPGYSPRDRLTKHKPEDQPAIRRWELLDGYTPEQVGAARLRGKVEADLIFARPRAEWLDCLAKIEHPLMRDAAADALRGW